MKKKIKTSVIVFCIIIIVIASFTFYTLFIASDNDVLEKTPYTNTEYGWSMKYPIGWDIGEGDFGDADFKDKSSDDIYLNIRVEPSNSDTLEEEIERKQEILVNDNIISQRNREINTMDSYEFIYRYEEGSDWIKVKHVLIEKDGKVFEIRYSAGINTYEKYVSLAEKCINTFEIL